jgi:hypothetical protein
MIWGVSTQCARMKQMIVVLGKRTCGGFRHMYIGMWVILDPLRGIQRFCSFGASNIVLIVYEDAWVVYMTMLILLDAA